MTTTTTTITPASSFSQSTVSCLTREEECLLKTALAMVVVKKKRKRGHQEEQQSPVVLVLDDPANNGTAANGEQAPNRYSLLDSLFQKRNVSSSSSLLQTWNPRHLDKMFHLACSMAVNNHNTTTSSTTNVDGNAPLIGTASHLAQQIQLWLQQPQPPDSSTTSLFQVQAWIRSTLLHSASSSFQVYQVLIPQVPHNDNSGLLETLLWVVAGILKDLYQDQIIIDPSTTSVDLVAVSSLRLLQTCLQHLPHQQALVLLQDCFHDVVDLLVPMSSNSSLVQTHWELARHHQQEDSSASATKGGCLDPGAKLLLRLGIYRILLQSTIMTTTSVVEYECSQQVVLM
jgi:hypothetical protein